MGNEGKERERKGTEVSFFSLSLSLSLLSFASFAFFVLFCYASLLLNELAGGFHLKKPPTIFSPL